MTASSQPQEMTSLRALKHNASEGDFVRHRTLLLCAFAVLIIVSFVSAFNDNARIDRLKSHGVSVVVTVTNWWATLAAAAVTARAIPATARIASTASDIKRSLVRKRHCQPREQSARCCRSESPSTIELASAVAKSSSSASVYVVPSVLVLPSSSLQSLSFDAGARLECER